MEEVNISWIQSLGYKLELNITWVLGFRYMLEPLGYLKGTISHRRAVKLKGLSLNNDKYVYFNI